MNSMHKTMRTAGDLILEYAQSLDARQRGEKHHSPSGFADLDKQFGAWLHAGHLIIVAGRPAMGKSVFAQQLAENIAEQQRTAIIFTLEMSGYEIIERSLSRRSRVSIQSLKTAELVGDELSRVVDSFVHVSRLPLLIDDASLDVTSLVEKTKNTAAALEKKELPPLGCIVIDYLQLVGAKAANRTLEIGKITSSLKKLAKELSVPVIALSQLNRGVENRTEKRPSLADLRESGNIEQDADLVLLIYRDDYYNKDSEFAGTAEIIAAKNRHGSNGFVRLVFCGENVEFRDRDYVY